VCDLETSGIGAPYLYDISHLRFKINRIITMPVGFYGCGTCLLSLREERRLRVFETRVLRVPKGDKVTGEWRKLHNEELNDL
jgi:hypothetical protein